MTSPAFRLRPFTWADVNALAALQTRLRPPPYPAVAAVRLMVALRDPGLRPERDLIVAESGGELAGYCLLTAEEPISRGVLNGGVRPDKRRLGIGRALLTAAVLHCRALRLRVVDVDVPYGEAAALALLVASGFTHVRTHLRLRRDATSVPEAAHEGVTLRLAQPADIARLTALQNAAFTGSWGFCPNTPEEIAYRVFGRYPAHPDAVVLAGRAGVLQAYCWTRVDDSQVGSIGMVGVEPTSQGQGLGRIVAAAAINELVRRGAVAIEITVDSGNAVAVRLYERLGFRLHARSLWYEARLS